MVFTKVFGDFVFSTLFAKNTPLRALGVRSGRSGEPLGGYLGGVPGAVPGPQRASWAHPWCDLGPPGGLLGASWGQLGTQKSPWRPLERAKNHGFYKGFWHFLVLGSFAFKNTALRALESDLGASGGVLGASWGLLGAVLGPQGPSWDPLEGVLGRLGRLLGGSWAPLGATFGGPKSDLEASWGPFLGRLLFCTFLKGRRAKNHVKTNVF